MSNKSVGPVSDGEARDGEELRQGKGDRIVWRSQCGFTVVHGGACSVV